MPYSLIICLNTQIKQTEDAMQSGQKGRLYFFIIEV